MSERVSTLLEVLGMVALTVAAGMVALPFGVAVLGVCLFVVGFFGGHS